MYIHTYVYVCIYPFTHMYIRKDILSMLLGRLKSSYAKQDKTNDATQWPIITLLAPNQPERS